MAGITDSAVQTCSDIADVTDSAVSADVRRRCRYYRRAVYQWPVFSGHPGRLFPTALMLVPQYSSMPVIPDGRIQDTQVSQYACDPRWQDSRYPNSGLLAVISDPESFDIHQFFNGVECFFFPRHVSRCPAVCVVRLLLNSLWCSAPVDIPTFSVESGGELQKIDLFQGSYSAGEWVAYLDGTVRDRSQITVRQIALLAGRDQYSQLNHSILCRHTIILLLLKNLDWLV